MQKGTGYLGSSSLSTSKVDQELIPDKPKGHSIRYNFYKFTFDNPEQDCTIVINNSSPIYIPAGKGFNIDSIDAPIWSFKIKEANIKYSWIGAY